MQAGTGNLKFCQPCEGQLYKYTNVMKGWQYRWFVLNPDKGTFEYYVSDTDKLQMNNRPRGALHLAGAVISPSEEDSHTFVVNSASGDVYKLRAADARERQSWITRLRIVAERHSHALAQTNSPLVSREHGSSTARMVPTNLSILDAFAQVQEWLHKAEISCQEVGISIDRFPISGSGTKSTDPDLLILKATSQTTLGNLQECLYALQMQQRATVKAEMQATSSSSSKHFQSYTSPVAMSSSSTPVTPTSASFTTSHRPSSSVSSSGAKSVHFSAN
ncbi:Oxysterol-binding protein-related protein 11 [Orchesella cincta]|uniref:Oxysterol-binding protein-related protein 11 n=1 Tax=Orchesella cincta TaxID=48709 RepID=A0A1D2MYH3_ORCCI|nr:Oxysterol-binding protein-related protein 11 [Orchesella cincta]